jgi:hypothetical protein
VWARGGLLVPILLLVTAIASAAPATLDVTAPKASVRVGDRVPVRVVARGGESLMWGELQVAVEADGPWAVVDPPEEVAGASPPVWELVLAPMEIGEVPLPEFGAGVRDANGETRLVEATDLPVVDVTSVLPPDEEVEPAPLRGPLGVTGFPWEWVLPFAIPVLVVAAGLAWWGRRRRKSGAGRSKPALAPFDELVALLDRLGGRIGREPAEAICDRLAGGLRRYLERASGEPAEEMTSFELRLLARRLEWPETVQRGIHAVMDTADRVRFGRLPADENRLRQAIEESRGVAEDLERHLVVDDEAEELEATG